MRNLADRDLVYRGLFEIMRLTNQGIEQVTYLHEFGACAVVRHALELASKGDVAMGLRACDAIIGLTQELPRPAPMEGLSVEGVPPLVVGLLSANMESSEVTAKALAAAVMLAEIRAETARAIEAQGICTLIVTAMGWVTRRCACFVAGLHVGLTVARCCVRLRKHKGRHQVQMGGMEAIKALAMQSLGPGCPLEKSGCIRIFFETMALYAQDRSIQVRRN
jgi:hypothetical protein